MITFETGVRMTCRKLSYTLALIKPDVHANTISHRAILNRIQQENFVVAKERVLRWSQTEVCLLRFEELTTRHGDVHTFDCCFHYVLYLLKQHEVLNRPGVSASNV